MTTRCRLANHTENKLGAANFTVSKPYGILSRWPRRRASPVKDHHRGSPPLTPVRFSAPVDFDREAT